MRVLLVLVCLVGVGCKSGPSIVGRYEDKNWLVGGRVDRWEFKADGTWRMQSFPDGQRLLHDNTGTYTYDGKKLTRVWMRAISYKRDGTVLRDTKLVAPNTETVNVIRNGENYILDPENKTTDGKTELVPVK